MNASKRSLIVILILGSLLWSCQKNDMPVEENYSFRFTVGNGFVKSSSRMAERKWVVLYTNDNKLLYEQELYNNHSYSFDLSEKNLNVHLITLQDYPEKRSNTNFYDISVYTDINPSHWILGSEPEDWETSHPIGSITVDLNDINLANIYSKKLKSSNQNCDIINTYENVYEVEQYYYPDDIWLMVKENPLGLPRYKWFPDVGFNESVSVSFDKLDEMTHYVDVDFPSNSSMVLYIEGDDPLTGFYELYDVYLNTTSSGSTSVRAYYPENTFNAFWTYYQVNNGGSSDFMIANCNEIPKEFETIKINTNILNRKLNNFEAKIVGKADICSFSWIYSDEKNNAFFHYIVNGESNTNLNYKPPSIPEAIKDLHPETLDLSKLKYYRAYYKDYSLINGFQDYIGATMIEQRKMNIKGSRLLYKHITDDETKGTPQQNHIEILHELRQKHIDFK